MTALIETLLRPVVRFALRSGIPHGQISLALKRALVREATTQIESSGQKLTTSRLAVMTGLTRREVLASQDDVEGLPPPSNIPARVISKWRTDKRFCSPSGKPKALTYKGTDSQFARLSYLVSQDLNSATVLFELERLKLVECRDGQAFLVGEFADYGQSTPKKMDLLARNMQTLIAASESNAYEPRELPELVLRTEYDNLLVSALPKLKAWVRKEGLTFHKRLRERLARYDKDLSNIPEAEGGGRIVVIAVGLTEQPDSSSSPQEPN